MGGEYLVWEGKENFCGFRDFGGFHEIDQDDFFEHLRKEHLRKNISGRKKYSTSNKIAKQLFNSTLLKKIQKQRPTTPKQSLKVFCKKKCSLKFRKLHSKAIVLESFFVKFQAFQLQVFQIQTPTQAPFCEVWETSKNTYFEEHLQATTSGGVL